MDTEKNLSLDELQIEVDEAVEGCSKTQLGQCARLLATYVALYKQEFGELNQDRFAVLTRKLAVDLEFGESIYATGLQELLETLSVVDAQAPDIVHSEAEVEVRTLN